MIQLNWYQIFGQSIPDGRTVTPTDDIQIWLHCANIWDKNYTTLAQVLADTDTLVALMASDNAVDYLVRSTSWSGISLVPTMTSNTTPSGECLSSGEYSTNYNYRGFDGNDSTDWASTQGTVGDWLGYKFTSPCAVGKVSIKNANRVTKLNYEVSDDGVTWTTKESNVSISLTAVSEFSVTSPEKHLYSRVVSTVKGGGVDRWQIYTLQFYSENLCDSEIAMKSIGASDYASTTLLSDSTWNNAIQNSTYFEYVDNVKVPTMTSNTAPSGEAIYSTQNTSKPIWQAFDGNDATEGATNLGTYAYIGYKFTEKVIVRKARINCANSSRTASIKTSNDGANWTELKSNIAIGTSVGVIDASIDYNYTEPYQYYCTMLGNSSDYISLYTLQFYGRQNGGVQTWLHAAGITNKNYTTLSEVLADTSTLSTLINNHSACDYLVTCKGWATTICADSTAMTYIGLNNYCANKLLADATWRTAICNSTYFESVLNVKVPTMTSNTTPSGEASATSSATGRPPYYAFDGDDTTLWNSNATGTTAVRYKFATKVKVYKTVVMATNTSGITTSAIKASNDNSTYTAITASKTSSDYVTPYVTFISDRNIAEYFYYEFEATRTNNNTVYFLQFYGREDV